MIPKIIHYCWFGCNPLPDSLQAYVNTWREFCPDYKIMLWNEKSFDINSHVFTKSAYAKRKYAFVSDYVRAYALYESGGIYLDTDVELKKGLDVFLHHQAFTGFEANDLPFTALWASIPKHSLCQKVLEYYAGREYSDSQETNTKSVSSILVEEFGIDPSINLLQVGDNGKNTIHVYPAEYFCLDLLPNYATHHFVGSWVQNNKKVTYKDTLHNQYHLDQVIKNRGDNFNLNKQLSKILNYKDLMHILWFIFYRDFFPEFLKGLRSKLRKRAKFNIMPVRKP